MAATEHTGRVEASFSIKESVEEVEVEISQSDKSRHSSTSEESHLQHKLEELQPSGEKDNEYITRAVGAMARQEAVGDKATYRLNDQALLLHLLQERGHGSALRGWRLELDPLGNLSCSFVDFCKAAARLKFAGDAVALFGGDGNNATLELSELSMRLGHLVDKFKGWMRDHFRAATPRKTMRLTSSAYKKLFDACDVHKEGKVIRSVFVASCPARGCPLNHQELNEIFDLTDYLDRGWVSAEDMIVLEPDKQVRELAMFVRKISNRTDLQESLAKDYLEHLRLQRGGAAKDVERKEIGDARPWRRHSFERHHLQYENLPHVLCHRRRERQVEMERRKATAREAFAEHAVSFYGNEVRMMRRGLDPQGTFSVEWTRFRQYCRQHNLELNVKDLWRSIDRDCDGRVGFWELCGHVAVALAKLLLWARQRFRSCASLWDCSEAVQVRRQCREERTWPSDKTMQAQKFMELLQTLGWAEASDPSMQAMLKSSLDLCDCGLVSRQDLQWLDGWSPPEWLLAEPDPQAWNDIKDVLIQEHKHLLRAWRLLDQGDTNCLSWSAFVDTCEKVKFEGNIAGAWCAADCDRSGMISIEEFDKVSAKMLLSFKEWSDKHFGSVFHCFRALDTDKSGTVRYMELRRALEKYHWPGNARVLFNCLDVRGHGKVIDFDEMTFLDNWAVKTGPKAGEAITDADSVSSPMAVAAASGAGAVFGSLQQRDRRTRLGKDKRHGNGRRLKAKEGKPKGAARMDLTLLPGDKTEELVPMKGKSNSPAETSSGIAMEGEMLPKVAVEMSGDKISNSSRPSSPLAGGPMADASSFPSEHPDIGRKTSGGVSSAAGAACTADATFARDGTTRPSSSLPRTRSQPAVSGGFRPKSAANVTQAGTSQQSLTTEEVALLPHCRRVATAPRLQNLFGKSEGAAGLDSPQKSPCLGATGRLAGRPKTAKSPYEATPEELLGTRTKPQPAKCPRMKIIEVENFTPELLQELLKAFPRGSETHLFTSARPLAEPPPAAIAK